MARLSPIAAGLSYLCGYVMLDVVADDRLANSLGVAAWRRGIPQ